MFFNWTYNFFFCKVKNENHSSKGPHSLVYKKSEENSYFWIFFFVSNFVKFHDFTRGKILKNQNFKTILSKIFAVNNFLKMISLVYIFQKSIIIINFEMCSGLLSLWVVLNDHLLFYSMGRSSECHIYV